MKNEYRIKLSVNGYVRYTNAIFGDDLAVGYNRASDEQVITRTLNGKITFVNDDYDYIINTPIDQRIDLIIEQQIANTSIWNTFLECYFYRTDCQINQDDKIIEVEPSTTNYDAFMGVLDKEVDIIKLAPTITPIMLDKRPCLQLYALGSTNISCILSNMSWEQECESIDNANDLLNTYHFAHWGNYVTAGLIGTNLPTGTPTFFSQKLAQTESVSNFEITNGQYVLRVSTYTAPDSSQRVLIAINKSGVRQWDATMALSEWGLPMTVTLTGYQGNPNIKLELANIDVYGRLISDAEAILGVGTYDLPINDFANNRNYHKVSPVPVSGDLDLAISGIFSATPTEWGRYQVDEYYTTPYVIGGGEFHPVLRDNWGRASLWVMQSTALDYVEQTGRKTVVLRDAYLLTDVISAILAEFMPMCTLQSTFLLSSGDPLDTTDPDNGILFITPKSNVLTIDYTEPARTAKITLRQIFDMLRVCYRLYWTLSYNGAVLRVEHIEWFRRGGRYSGNPIVGTDLTNYKTVRNGKYWAYLTNKYRYDKFQMPIRYEFGWMDDATLPFNGLPINMLSNYVDQSKVDKYMVNYFDADVDYLMLNPSGVSKDGFVVIKATQQNVLGASIAVGGQNSIAVLMSYDSPAGETVRVEYQNTGVSTIYAYDSAGHRIAQIDRTTGDGDWSASWELPAGTKHIVIAFGDSPCTFILDAFYPAMAKALYVNWNYNGITDHWLQNGRLSFVYLARYYAYDMPCRNYSIGSGQYLQTLTAKGVAKNKLQDIIMPTSGDVDMEEVIRTGLGNGKIRNLTLNLSSKMANVTLEYDTE